jgi:phosphoglycerol transferase MdoB-like AlkP superfamily enzyme
MEVLLFVALISFKSWLAVAGTVFSATSTHWATFTLLMFVAVPALFLQLRARRLVLLISVVALNTLFFTDKVHYRAFHDFATVREIGHAGQLLDVFTGIFPYVRAFDLWWIADWPLWIVLFGKTSRTVPRKPSNPYALRLLAMSLALSALAYGYAVSDFLVGRLEKRLVSNRGFAVKEVGLLNYHLFDLADSVLFPSRPVAVDDNALRRARDWFERRESPGRAVVPFGAARGFNLIYVQVESLEAFLIGLRVDGQEITPHLNRLTTNSLYFRLFFPQTGIGSTSDAEFCALNSLLPARHGVVARNYANNTFRALPTILRKFDYDTIALSACLPNLWNMGPMHRAYGFRRRYYNEHFARPGEGQLDIPDDRFLALSRATLKRHRQPFFAHLMTISTHVPFTRIPAGQKTLKLTRWNGTILGNYLQAAHFVDGAIGTFIDGLNADGLGTNTVLVIYGDHQALPDDDWKQILPLVSDVSGARIDRALRRRVPAFILVPGVAPIAFTNRPAGQIDLPPTMLHLLGISEREGLFVGNNLLRDGSPPVFFRNGSFITASHYSPEASGASSAQCLPLEETSTADPGDCARNRQRVAERISISDLVLENDLLRRLKPD